MPSRIAGTKNRRKNMNTYETMKQRYRMVALRKEDHKNLKALAQREGRTMVQVMHRLISEARSTK
jgi:hypothetical protein